MKSPCIALALLVLLTMTASQAQVLSPNEAGVALGHWRTIARNVETTKKFWLLVGGTPVKVGSVEAMKFPGVLILIEPGSLADESGNKGSVLDHPGFNMKNGEAFLSKLKAAGLKVDPIEGRGADSGYIHTPDGLRVEMQGNENDVMKRTLLGFTGKELDVTIASDHLHYLLPESAVDEAQAWYGKWFGANPLRENNRGKTPAGDVPGIRLRFGAARNATLVPTKGRALSSFGFEVKSLEAFCKKLEASGIKLDQPYSKSRHKDYASAELTDPWGTSIELTEGLSPY